MSFLDFNDAAPQRDGSTLIPAGTIALAVMTVRPGGVGPGGVLKLNKAGDKEMLDVEFTISAGPYERRKIWTLFTVSAQGESDAPNISRAQLRAALESAHGVLPSDVSEAAQAKRNVAGWMAFDGLTVCIKIGVEKANGDWPEKNKLVAFITPDQRDYIPTGPQPQATGSAGFQSVGQAAERVVAAAAAGQPKVATAKPAWAS